MHSSFENTIYIDQKSHFYENFEKLCKFSLKIFLFCNIYLVERNKNFIFAIYS